MLTSRFLVQRLARQPVQGRQRRCELHERYLRHLELQPRLPASVFWLVVVGDAKLRKDQLRPRLRTHESAHPAANDPLTFSHSTGLGLEAEPMPRRPLRHEQLRWMRQRLPVRERRSSLLQRPMLDAQVLVGLHARRRQVQRRRHAERPGQLRFCRSRLPAHLLERRPGDLQERRLLDHLQLRLRLRLRPWLLPRRQLGLGELVRLASRRLPSRAELISSRSAAEGADRSASFPAPA